MIWYTSDLHFGHAKCAEWRGFDSTEQHDATIVNNWNRLVKDDDIVYVLGDVCISSGALDTVDLLKGHKRLITGNHDAPHPMHRTAHLAQPRWLKHFESIAPYARRISAGTEFLMCHHPYVGDHTPVDRDLQYRLPNRGIPIVHGHVHSGQILTYARGIPQIHVGLDAWSLAPVREDAVVDLIGLTLSATQKGRLSLSLPDDYQPDYRIPATLNQVYGYQPRIVTSDDDYTDQEA